jgi:hypothetical protein
MSGFAVLLSLALLLALSCDAVSFVPFEVVAPTGFKLLRRSANSSLFEVQLPTTTRVQYTDLPMVLSLSGSRKQVGYDYAALLHVEASETIGMFLSSLGLTATEQSLLTAFLDFTWDTLLEPHVDQKFLDELAGMDSFTVPAGVTPTGVVSRRFFALANMPADPQNIISMLENDLEDGLPQWLKDTINTIIKWLERIVFKSCDAFSAWGPRTVGGDLFSSRNLDYNSDTGINKHKLVVVYSLPGVQKYASLGFTFGMGALAGISTQGVTVSEMNLDNSVVTFKGPPFPLRLRKVLEEASSLQQALAVWNATQNTNSFNFLIASAADKKAVALETIRGFTQVYADNSPIEAAATVDCSGNSADAKACPKWTTQTGTVHIGSPIPNAVWRSNHAFSPRVYPTQEPLFNNTVVRYQLQHDLISGLTNSGQLIGDNEAIGIVATLGTKGADYFTCLPHGEGDNVMSIAYAPRVGGGHFYIAWESGSGASWQPAACSPYVRFDLQAW